MADDLADLPAKKWWVFFIKSPGPQRWHYRLWPPFLRWPWRHCYACCEVTDNVCLWLDPKDNGLVTSLVMGRPAKHIELVQRAGGRVLFVEFPMPRTDLDGPGFNRQGLILTCASVIAFALGLDSRAVSPGGLWRVLVTRYNAKEVCDGRISRRRRQSRAGRPAETGA